LSSTQHFVLRISSCLRRLVISLVAYTLSLDWYSNSKGEAEGLLYGRKDLRYLYNPARGLKRVFGLKLDKYPKSLPTLWMGRSFFHYRPNTEYSLGDVKVVFETYTLKQ